MVRRSAQGSAARPSVGLLHALNHLLRLNRRLSHPHLARRGNRQQASLAVRRRRQRRDFAKQLVEVNDLFSSFTSKASGWWFWRGLRWGGPAMLIGWWLAQAASG